MKRLLIMAGMLAAGAAPAFAGDELPPTADTRYGDRFVDRKAAEKVLNQDLVNKIKRFCREQPAPGESFDQCVRLGYGTFINKLAHPEDDQ